jgi:hypothetical protein
VKWLDKENIWALLGEQNSVVDYLRWDEHRGEYVNSKGASMGKERAEAKQKCVAEHEKHGLGATG